MKELEHLVSQAVEAPEILLHIFKHVSTPDCARLATTSRTVFRALVPRIWRDVPNVLCLLSLIPGISLVSLEKPNREVVNVRFYQF